MVEQAEWTKMKILRVESFEDYEFIRQLRTDPRTESGFLTKAVISPSDQIEYMSKHKDDYYVCYYNQLRVGYCGVIDNDIRFCVVPYYHGMGIGKFMLRHMKNLYPEATGRIKRENFGSIMAFQKEGIKFTIV